MNIEKLKTLHPVAYYELANQAEMWVEQANSFKTREVVVHPLNRETINLFLDIYNRIKRMTGLNPQELHNFLNGNL